MTSPNGTVTRRVFFYRLVDPDDRTPVADGFGEEVTRRLSQIAIGERVIDLVEGERKMICQPEGVQGISALQLGTIRTAAFPRVIDYLETGDITDLALAQGRALLDVGHLVFFPDGVVGAEFEMNAPRVTRVPDYLREVVPSLPNVRLETLLRRDVLEQVRQLESVTLMEIELSRADADRLLQSSQGRDLEAGLRAQGDDAEAESIRLSYKAGRRRGASLNLSWLNNLIATPGLREAASRLVVRGRSDMAETPLTINLLNDHIVSSKTVARLGDNRVVSTRDVLTKIVGAYQDRRSDIALAVGAAIASP